MNLFILSIGLPILLWFLGDYPMRTLFKDSIAVLTLLALCLLFVQFFISGINPTLLEKYRLKDIVKVHKYIGYAVIGFFILHPLFIVLPRFFEAGLLPQDALIKLLTTFETRGQIVGLVAYILMFVLGVTSLLRHKLGITYTTWKLLHGFLSLAFIILASWHAIDMGRHFDTALSIWTIILVSLTAIILLKNYGKVYNEKKAK